MREKNIESKLAAEVRRRGGLAPKFVSPGLDGVPDRLILLPGGKAAFSSDGEMECVLPSCQSVSPGAKNPSPLG